VHQRLPEANDKVSEDKKALEEKGGQNETRLGGQENSDLRRMLKEKMMGIKADCT
jgi:hypothetical protein